MSDETRAEIEAYEPNQRLALLCIDDTDRKAEVSAAVQELGYRPHVGGAPAAVLERLRGTTYDVVVIDEGFAGATPLDHPVLRAVAWLPMSVRRYMFVALLAPDVKTMDDMTAVARSVNIVVNDHDVGHIKTILERAILANDQFYRVFRHVLQEAGKR